MFESTNCKDLRKVFGFLEGHNKLQNTYTEKRERGDKLMFFVLKIANYSYAGLLQVQLNTRIVQFTTAQFPIFQVNFYQTPTPNTTLVTPNCTN